jgi:predicted dehydrogenase
MAYKMIQVGTGGFGGAWCRNFLPPNVQDGLIEKFVRWLEGGPAMETEVQANLQAAALIFAAIESSRTGQPVKVQEFLAKARQKT